MLICDTHADTLWAMQSPRRDPNAPLDVTYEHLRRSADVRVQTLALFVPTGGMEQSPNVVERELQMLARLKAQGFRQIARLEEAAADAPNVLLSVEGGEAFGGDPAEVDRLAGLGVRMAALVWNNENGLAVPAVRSDDGGLTALGRQMVARMRRARMALDVSHLNRAGFWEVLDGQAPPLASHSCAYALCPHPRNLDDGQLRALFDAGGFVGVNFYPAFLSPDARADLDTVARHIAHMCELGGEGHVGLGSDFDGIDAHPLGLNNAGDVPALLAHLEKRGFGRRLVQDVAGRNFERYLQRLDACQGPKAGV